MTNDKKDMNRLKKVSKVMETFWLVVAIGSLLYVLYIMVLEKGINAQNAQFLVIPGLAAIMYGFRAAFRRRMEKNQENQQ